ncbi:tyrosine-type recombinase/integrase [Nonomuraea spiralis]|uniref:Tyrosine-type recombinase/integrase n=1 Tax=Nonomuraea spiralis TaxID=46182 RepID=A0ABV5IS23_9ACTN|nr:site-specific integrase [Nonomuraea spiralis]
MAPADELTALEGAPVATPNLEAGLLALASLSLPAVVVPADEHRIATAAAMKDPYDTYLASLDSDESRRTMGGCLDRLARLILGRPLDDASVSGRGQPWWLLRYEHTVQLRVQILGQGWSDAHVNKHLSALRRVLEEAWRLGGITGEDYHRARGVKDVKGERAPAGRYIPDEVIGALLAACLADETPAGARDAALIAVLDSCGLRRAEAANLAMDDYGALTAGMLRVVGKGNKERHLPLSSFTTSLLERWLAVRGDGAGALFPRLERNGIPRIQNGRPRHMQPQGIADILTKRSEDAKTRRVRPHDMRRTFISNVLPVVDAIKAAKLAGHTRPETTMAYDLRPAAELRDDIERLRKPAIRPLNHHPHATGDADA